MKLLVQVLVGEEMVIRNMDLNLEKNKMELTKQEEIQVDEMIENQIDYLKEIN